MKPFFRKHIVTLLVLFFLSIPFTLQLLQPGFFVGDDGEWMIIRSSAFHEALRDGQIPVRYLGRLNNEFGYPVATFLYPGYLYLTEPLVIAGISFVESIKIMFALTMVSSGIFSYFWLSKLFNKWSAFIGALVYLYTPYHLVDMYNRGSLGEMLALAMVPFTLWQIERKSILFSSIGLAGLILSHNIMAALFLPVILIYSLLSAQVTHMRRTLHALRLVGMTFGFGLGLAAFFWIPALFELSNTVFNQTKISEWQHYFASFAYIGVLQVVLLVTSALVLVLKKKKKDAVLPIFFILLGMSAVFFSSALSTPFWNILPVTFIQFPFRFLSLEILAVAYLAGYLATVSQHKAYRVFYIFTIVLALGIIAYPYFKDVQPFDKGEGFYTTNQSTTTTRDEYMPVWVREKSVQRVDQKVEISKGTGQVSNILVTNKKISFSVTTTSNAVVQINKIYWPGWNAEIDGKKTNIIYTNPKGLMTVTVSQGTHAVQLFFQETPLRLFADSMSILTLLLLGGISIKKTKLKSI